MAAKCNITKYAVEKINKLKWGFKCSIDIEDKILENWLEYIACPTLDLVICDNSDCSNPTITFECELVVSGISALVNENVLSLYLSSGNISGGTPPYTYLWTFEANDLVVTGGGINTPQIDLVPIDDKDLDLIVATIGVEVTDANNCKSTKECVFTPQGLQCTVDFIACEAPSGLVVINPVVFGVPPRGLIVIPID